MNTNQSQPLQDFTNVLAHRYSDAGASFGNGEYDDFFDGFPLPDGDMQNKDDGVDDLGGARTTSNLNTVSVEPRGQPFGHYNPFEQPSNATFLPHGASHNTVIYDRSSPVNPPTPVNPNLIYRNVQVPIPQGYYNQSKGANRAALVGNQRSFPELTTPRLTPNTLSTAQLGHQNLVYSTSNSKTPIGPFASNIPPNYQHFQPQRLRASTPSIPLPPLSNLDHPTTTHSNSATTPVTHHAISRGTIQARHFGHQSIPPLNSRLPLNNTPASSNSPVNNSSGDYAIPTTPTTFINNQRVDSMAKTISRRASVSNHSSRTQPGTSASAATRFSATTAPVNPPRSAKTSKTRVVRAPSLSSSLVNGDNDSGFKERGGGDESDSSNREKEVGEVDEKESELDDGEDNDLEIVDADGNREEDEDPTLIDPNRIDSDDEIDFFGRDRRQNIFSRPAKTGVTIFKQRNTLKNQKYFRILEKQGKLKAEEIKAINKEYAATEIFSTLDKDDKRAWTGVAAAIATGHQNFSFISEAQRPELAKRALARSHADVFQAFNFPVLSIVFPPGAVKGDALYVITDYKGGLVHPYTWLDRKRSSALKEFTRSCLDYADAIWNPGEPLPKEPEKKKKKKDDFDPILQRLTVEERDGIRIWKETILNVNVETARRVYHAGLVDRYRRNGWPVGDGEVLYWNYFVGPNRNIFLHPDVLPRVELAKGDDQEARFCAYSRLNKLDTDAWMKFYLAHQAGDIGWEEGMVFVDIRRFDLDASKSRIDIADLVQRLTADEDESIQDQLLPEDSQDDIIGNEHDTSVSREKVVEREPGVSPPLSSILNPLDADSEPSGEGTTGALPGLSPIPPPKSVLPASEAPSSPRTRTTGRRVSFVEPAKRPNVEGTPKASADGQPHTETPQTEEVTATNAAAKKVPTGAKKRGRPSKQQKENLQPTSEQQPPPPPPPPVKRSSARNAAAATATKATKVTKAAQAKAAKAAKAATVKQPVKRPASDTQGKGPNKRPRRSE